jgi:DNA-binding transcriptional MerR regulator
MDGLAVGAAAKATGWSARMLRYLEQARLVVPKRSPSGYRVYGLRELNQLRSLLRLRSRYGVELTDIAFAARMRSEPVLRGVVARWLAGADIGAADWVDWEQRKHERLLAA